MLEGLIQSYLDHFGKDWAPRDEREPQYRDSPDRKQALL